MAFKLATFTDENGNLFAEQVMNYRRRNYACKGDASKRRRKDYFSS